MVIVEGYPNRKSVPDKYREDNPGKFGENHGGVLREKGGRRELTKARHCRHFHTVILQG